MAEGWPGGLGLLCTGWTNSTVLPKDTGNCILHPVINRDRKKNHSALKCMIYVPHLVSPVSSHQRVLQCPDPSAVKA